MREAVLHYRIVEQIGEGGMGLVYKALDTRLNRLVAIKILRGANDPKRRMQFTWEARAAAGLHHPNIVVVHDISSDQGMDFIVMEYIAGQPLSELLARGSLPLADVLRYARQTAGALEAAHKAGIVHRDLKPANILVDPRGQVKLVDFGLARLQQPETETQGAAIPMGGTYAYMSPEQTNGEPATAQSDIFSFGAVLYEMVTGRPAFSGQTPESIQAAVRRQDPPRASELVPALPPGLEKVIELCLRKDPGRRFHHIGDVRLALEEIGSASPRPARRKPLSALMYCAAVILPLLAVSLLLSRYSDQSPPSMPIPLTSFPGAEVAASWSPDGRQVAFGWDGEKQDNHDIYVLQPGISQTLRLTTDPGDDTGPAWSPDGRWIAYAHSAAGRQEYSLRMVSPLGGPERTLFTSALPVSGAAWSPDGRDLAFETAAEPGLPHALWTISIDSGKRRRLTWPPPGIPGDQHPAISPDAKLLAFCRKTAWRTAELFTVELDPELQPRGTPRRLTDMGYVAEPAWTPKGDRILFEAHREGTGIWQIDRRGGKPRPVFGVPNAASHPAVSKRPDGRTSLVFSFNLVQNTIWRYSTIKGPGGPPVELVPSSRSQSYPRYSNDGKRLAFTSSRTGFPEIWVANADGTQPAQLTELRHQLTEVGHWTPNDDAIAFVSQDRSQRQVYLVSSSGGPAVPITAEEGVRHGSGWSRDGTEYYFDASRSGRMEARKVARGGGPSRSAVEGGQCAFESSRGFYYVRPGEDGWLMRRTPGGDQPLSLGPVRRTCPFPLSPHGFYYASADGSEVRLYDEETNRSTLVLSLAQYFNLFSVSPDGRWFVSDFLRNLNVDLMIMEEFR